MIPSDSRTSSWLSGIRVHSGPCLGARIRGANQTLRTTVMQLPMSLHLQLVQALDFAISSERSPQQVCNVGCLAVSVLLARPGEPAQTILTTAGHDVHMKMSDALTDDVVVGHERAVSIEGGRHRRRDRAHALEERADLFGHQLGKRHDVTPRHDQGVPWE